METTDKKKYLGDNSKLMSEWNWEKNSNISPYKLTCGSNKKVWWLCEKGHEWEATICNRAKGTRCPYCTGKKSLVGYNDLSTACPELAAQWHPIKNGDRTPQMFTVGSTKKVWWLCQEGHEWETEIYHRTRGGGCPICSNQKILAGYNDLATTHPELAEQWHPTKNGACTPQMVIAGSNKKAWWLCEKGHEWQAVIGDRARSLGCPVCSNQKLLVGYNDLATTHPELAVQWHPTKNGDRTPQMVFAGNNKKAWWICDKGHEWEATVNSRRSGHGCPLCSGEAQTSFPEQAILYYLQKVTDAQNRATVFGKEIDIWLPHLRVGVEYNGSYYHRNKTKKDVAKVSFFAEKGIRIITLKDAGRNNINGDVIEHVYGKKDWSSLNWAITELFALIDIPSPEINVALDAPEIHAQYIQQEKEFSLANKFPSIAAQWHPTKNGALTPQKIAAKSGKIVWWQCAKEHEWRAAVNDRTKGNTCPTCSNKRILVGYNDLATTHPELAAQWHPTKNEGRTAKMYVSGSHKKVWWLCEKKHEWQAIIFSRTNGRSCPICGNQKALAGYNDLATTHPKLAAQWHPVKNGNHTPQMVVAGSNKKAWWLCEKDHEWEATVNSRRQGRGCPFCNRGGK